MRTEMTMGEFIKLKRQLESNIYTHIREFERVTGSTVRDVLMMRVRRSEIGHPDGNEELAHVKAELELPL